MENETFFFINKKYRKGEYKPTPKKEPEKENPKPGSLMTRSW